MTVALRDVSNLKGMLMSPERDRENKSLAESPTANQASDATESYMYLSSKEATRSDLSRVSAKEDPSLDQIHFLLEKAKKFRAKNQVPQEPPQEPPRQDNFKVSSTPAAQKFNFKPKTGLLQTRVFHNSPLSQSTPLLVQLDKTSDQPEQDPRQNLIRNRLSSALAREMDIQEEQEENRDKRNAGSDMDRANGELADAPATKETVLEWNKPSNDTDAPSELEKLKQFLSSSEQGRTLLKKFETGDHVRESSTSVGSRSVTSTPQNSRVQAAQLLSQSSLSTSTLHLKDDAINDADELRGELELLTAKLEDADEMIRGLEIEKTALLQQTTAKEHEVEELKARISELDLQGPASDDQHEKLSEIIKHLVGNEDEAITREFLRSNGCEPLYNDLELDEIDTLTHIELQNALKEIVITIGTRYSALPNVIATMVKFFKDDYLRLICFVKEAHDALYTGTKIRIPEIYILNWTSGDESESGPFDEDALETFDLCLKDMAKAIRTLARTLAMDSAPEQPPPISS